VIQVQYIIFGKKQFERQNALAPEDAPYKRFLKFCVFLANVAVSNPRSMSSDLGVLRSPDAAGCGERPRRGELLFWLRPGI
jgi:hypothetical protein